MHLVVLSLGSVALGLPIFSLEARTAQLRSLVNVSPVVSPKLSLGQILGCLGIGISVCNPINVNGTQNSDNNNSNSKATSNNIGHDDHNCTTSTSSSPDAQQKSAAGNSDSGGLINVAPVISPDISLSNPNSCVGVGISACDPINVNGKQGSDNQ